MLVSLLNRKLVMVKLIQWSKKGHYVITSGRYLKLNLVTQCDISEQLPLFCDSSLLLKFLQMNFHSSGLWRASLGTIDFATFVVYVEHLLTNIKIFHFLEQLGAGF